MNETIGRGAVVIGLLTTSGEAGTDRRDGAALAMRDVGLGRISLVVQRTEPIASRFEGAARALAEREAKLIIGPDTPSQIREARSGAGNGAVPILAYASNSAPVGNGVLAFVSDEIDSAVGAAGHAAREGRRNIVAVVPLGVAQVDLMRLRRGMADQGARLLGLITFSPADRNTMARHAGLLRSADAVLLFGGLDNPAETLWTLRRTGALRSSALVLGTSRWRTDLYLDPVLEGALLCLPDQTDMIEVAERFAAKYGRPMSLDAAYAYDAVSMVANIVRKSRQQALTEQQLKEPPGFSGLLGSFRFEADGTVKRYCTVSRIAGGALQPAETPLSPP